MAAADALPPTNSANKDADMFDDAREEPASSMEGGGDTNNAADSQEKSVQQQLAQNPRHDINAEDSPPRELLSFWDVTAIQTCFSTAAVVIMMPYMYGQLGYVLALIVTAVWQLLTYLIACFICDVVLASDGRCKRLADAGYELGGKWGRLAFQIFQYVNLLMYLPVALDTIAISLQVVFGYPFRGGIGCIGWWKLIVFAILFVVVMLTKNWKESSRLAYVTWAVLTIKAFILIPYGLVKDQSDYKSSEMNLGPSQPFGNPQPNVWSIFGCLIGYLSASVMILVETMAHTEKPEEYKKALGLSNCFMWLYYAVPGLCASLLWGWNVDFLINEEFGTDALSVVLNLFIAIPVTLDFVIASIPVNDGIRRRFIDKESDVDAPVMNGKSLWWHQFKVTFPTLVFSFLFCIVIPHYDVLTSLLSSLTIVPMVTFVPSLVWLFGGKRKEYNNTWMLLHLTSFGIGVTVFAVEFAYSIYGIATTDYAPEAFWCQSSA